MHILFKLNWALRALFFSIFFGSFGLPGYIGKPTFILGARQIRIGRRVRIFPGLRAEAHGRGRILIHDNVAIGQDAHITAVGDLHIRSGCLISGNVMITDIDHEYRDVATSLFDQPFIQRATDIGPNCFLGIGVRIQAGTILGEGCVVGANAVVRGEFPPHSVIVGAPARAVKRYDPDSAQWRSIAKSPTNERHAE